MKPLTKAQHRTSADLSVEMIPADSRVEIDAKINAGYFTTGEVVTADALKEVQGRGWAGWEDVAH
jgi:hypothetical protein